jgi:transposase-like protein
MMGFKTFRTARITIAGIELVNMLRKGQMRSPDGESAGWVEQFFSLAFAT